MIAFTVIYMLYNLVCFQATWLFFMFCK